MILFNIVMPCLNFKFFHTKTRSIMRFYLNNIEAFPFNIDVSIQPQYRNQKIWASNLSIIPNELRLNSLNEQKNNPETYVLRNFFKS